MTKLLSIAIAAMLLLTACAGRSTPQTTESGAKSASGSSVEFYGTIDAGIGSQRISR